ncbi:AAA family ATPase [Anaerotignum sp. MB30-C6]|uniref:AAA family ATPase n=1 Tax=Anaerotignum sp. MB30-C6 TaxID=3070814 RepID=UPI0027DBF00E|nr:AAA family ATPase [Anaerotignum sp. MB30-C6]WMI82412.1 ParA family protein [Anaerotignum sp. MB30-C6]
MNFMKSSIFSRGQVQKVPKEQALHGGVLAVWGSPSSGKTTVAVKIAKYLADKKKNVVLVLCDTTAPMLPCICPPSDLECEKSLGSILAAQHVTESLVKYHMITHKKMDYLTILGMLKGENEYSYASYNETQAKELIASLRKIAPFVIIDCGSYIASDILSAIALLNCDSMLRLANCDLKSISYLSSQLSILQTTGLDFEKQYKCASNVKSNHGIEHMAGTMGSLIFQIPHSDEVEQQYLEGNLFADLTLKDSREFRKEIEKIVKEVFGC